MKTAMKALALLAPAALLPAARLPRPASAAAAAVSVPAPSVIPSMLALMFTTSLNTFVLFPLPLPQPVAAP